MLIRYLSALLLLSCAFGLAKADEASDRADKMLKAGDQDKNGKFEWKEAFERWNNARESMQIAEGDEALEEKVRDAFPDVIEALDFLCADANDDLVLTRNELIECFKIQASGKDLKPSRKDLEAFNTEMVNHAWPVICKLLDANSDGVLSRAELDEKYPTDVNDECFKAADKNKSGSLDKTEYAIFKVEEHERGLFVEFDERGGSVGGAGGTGAQAGEDEPEKENERKEEPKKGDAERRSEVKEKKSSRIRVGASWLSRSLIQGKAADGSGKETWHYQLATVTAITTKGEETTVVWKSVQTNEKGDPIEGGSGGGGSRVLYTGKNAKLMPAAKDLVQVTVAAGTFACSLLEFKVNSASGGSGKGKKSIEKLWETYIDGMPLNVKRELDGIIISELVEFREE